VLRASSARCHAARRSGADGCSRRKPQRRLGYHISENGLDREPNGGRPSARRGPHMCRPDLAKTVRAYCGGPLESVAYGQSQPLHACPVEHLSNRRKHSLINQSKVVPPYRFEFRRAMRTVQRPRRPAAGKLTNPLLVGGPRLQVIDYKRIRAPPLHRSAGLVRGRTGIAPCRTRVRASTDRH